MPATGNLLLLKYVVNIIHKRYIKVYNKRITTIIILDIKESSRNDACFECSDFEVKNASVYQCTVSRIFSLKL